MKEEAGFVTATAGDEGAGVSAASSEPMQGIQQEEEQEDVMQEDKPNEPEQHGPP